MKSIVTWMWDDSPAPGARLRVNTPGQLIFPQPAPLIEPEISIDERKRIERQDRRDARRSRHIAPPPRLRPLRGPEPRLKRQFRPEYVNTLQKMCARQLPEKHRFICISDSGDGLAPEVEWIKTPPEAKMLSILGSPEGERFPSCYRRLWSFSDDAKILGTRILCIDIDLVAVRDLRPIFDLPHDFVGWRPHRDWGRRLRFGGGMYLLTPGRRSHVWESFKGLESILKAREEGFRGSDQAWISYCLADTEFYWPKEMGLYSVRDLGPGLALPPDARVVQFNGYQKPWHHRTNMVAAVPWVVDNWR